MTSTAPPQIALVLSGGNALGSYEAGAYQAMHERSVIPDVIAGASIGALNGAVIAGNPPGLRIEKLRQLWRQAALGSAFGFAPSTGKARERYNGLHALQTLLTGRPGMFVPRLPGMLSILPGMPPDISMFDSKPLVATLERLVDYELLNSAALQLLVPVVDLETGETVVFDNRRQPFDARHFLATTAFTPGFAPVEIDGRAYGDPGLTGNLPLDAVLDAHPTRNVLCFAVDLFDSRGIRPHSLDTALERTHDLAFSGQSLRALESRSREHRLRHIIGEMAASLPHETRERLQPAGSPYAGIDVELTVVMLAYRAPAHELSVKTLDFSQASIEDRWSTGYRDMVSALDLLDAGIPTSSEHGYTFYDARRSSGAVHREGAMAVS